jgi:hypothetical protein
MRIGTRNSLIAIGVALAMSVGMGVGPAAASVTAAPTSLAASTTSDQGFTIKGTDGSFRSIVPDAVNNTSFAGLSATISMESTDQIVVSEDARTVMLQDENGGVLLNSTKPTLGQQGQSVPAKFVVEGDKLITTPIEPTGNQARSACASSFWGNLIFNIGMAGVCAMLGIASAGVGGVACTMAVIGANLGIDWDAQC